MTRFNPLDFRTGLAAISPPAEESAWAEHLPFARVIVEILRPRVIVELGVHTGASYLAFCEAVSTLGLSTTCFGFDVFVGDEHAGAYGLEIEAQLHRRHDPLYGAFSQIIRSTFDDAAAHVGDGTIDLLHIDGLHTYDAVAHDFATWLPKLSPRGVVMFHDTNVHERGFGVWKLWDEVRRKYPSFELRHGHGLGVLAVGKERVPALEPLLQQSEDDAERVEQLYFLLGSRITLQAENAILRGHLAGANELHKQIAALHADATAHAREVERHKQQVTDFEEEVLELEAERAQLRRQNAALEALVAKINSSVSFRIGVGATAPLRWVAGRLVKS